MLAANKFSGYSILAKTHIKFHFIAVGLTKDDALARVKELMELEENMSSYRGRLLHLLMDKQLLTTEQLLDQEEVTRVLLANVLIEPPGCLELRWLRLRCDLSRPTEFVHYQTHPYISTNQYVDTPLPKGEGLST